MINHLRTLLVNVTATPPWTGYPGEEAIDPNFTPYALPQAFQVIDRALFGSTPDRALRNYRVHELLACAHGAGYDAYVRQFDPRITYWPVTGGLFAARAAGVAARSLVPNPDVAFHFLPGATPGELSGRIYRRWTVTRQGSGTLAISTYADQLGPESTDTVTLTGEATAPNPVTLPGSSLQFQLLGTGLTSHYAFDVTVLARPTRTLIEVVAALEGALGLETETLLFPDQSSADARLFANLWRGHDLLPHRVAGFVLAYGHRLHELRG